jgi:tRNA U34 2-thiouridine synthase MnmA/TrmU
MQKEKTKAVALLSGGLDSTLAVKMMMDQGIDVYALNFTSSFCTCDAGSRQKDASGQVMAGCKSEARRVSEELGIPVKVVFKGKEYIDLVRNPKHGYGKGVNPCVDCRIYIFKAAKEYMEEIGASFIISGEVLGQRPMSQRHDTFPVIDRESGLEGLILRPLSAHCMEPTIPEKTGLVDREKLLAVTGRSRKPQIALAEELEIGDFPCPSGGCLLTDKLFSKKVRDLFDHKKDLSAGDLQRLKVGRHFRYNSAKIIVGRDDAENTKIKTMATNTDDTLIEPLDFPGPVALVTPASPDADNKVMDFAISLVVRYSSGKAAPGSKVTTTTNGEGAESNTINVTEAASEEIIKERRVC